MANKVWGNRGWDQIPETRTMGQGGPVVGVGVGVWMKMLYISKLHPTLLERKKQNH